MTNEQQEQTYFDELLAIDKSWKHSYARVGIICREVRNGQLHQQRIDPETGEPFTWTAWIRAACPWSYATAFNALRDLEALADIPDDDLVEIPASNFPILKQLSTAVRAEPAILKGAKTKRTEEFVEQIQESHPEQHVEHKKLMRFNPEESAAEKIEEALKMAQLHGAKTRNEALEMLAEEAMTQWRLEDELLEIASRMVDDDAAEGLSGGESVGEPDTTSARCGGTDEEAK